jgi:hypothetical protein
MTFPGILFGHWLGDFVMQSREIAENKGKSNLVLAKHVLIYSSVFVQYALLDKFIFVGKENHYSLAQWIPFILVNAVLHFITDYVTSRMTTKAYQAGDMKRFWNIIGIDQWIHATCLYMTWYAMEITK